MAGLAAYRPARRHAGVRAVHRPTRRQRPLVRAFFGLERPLLALIDLAVLWCLIVLTMFRFARVSRRAAALLAPYLAWVTFAGYLNAGIVVLN